MFFFLITPQPMRLHVAAAREHSGCAANNIKRYYCLDFFFQQLLYISEYLFLIKPLPKAFLCYPHFWF